MSFFRLSNAKPIVKALESCLPNIIFNTDALIKMQLFIENCADEVGWLGTAIKAKSTIYIDDVFLFDQEVHSTTTEITPEGLSIFAEAILTQPNGMEVWNNIRVWGHSHVNMSTSSSGQDDKQMVTFSDGGHDWFIRIIANKKGEIKVDLYEYNLGIIYYDLPWEEEVSDDVQAIYDKIDMLEGMLQELNKSKVIQLESHIKKEIEVKVRKKSWGMPSTKASKTTAKTYQSNYHVMTTDIDMTSGEVGIDWSRDKALTEKEISFINLFGYDMMLELGTCINVTELKDTMTQYGIQPLDFSEIEVINIYTAAQRINDRVYGLR